MRLLIPTLILVVSFMMMSCSADGELNVVNSTNAAMSVSIDGLQKNISANSSTSKKWSLSKTLFSTEEKSITISGEGLFKFHFTENAKVKAGTSKSYQIIADAGGLEIDNNSASSYIYEVYIAPSSDTEWGIDQLSGTINPGGYVIWRVSPGSWDVLVVDDQNKGYASYNNNISANQLVGLPWAPVNAMFLPDTGQKNRSGEIKPDMKVERLNINN